MAELLSRVLTGPHTTPEAVDSERHAARRTGLLGCLVLVWWPARALALSL